ncbi:argininosuccinate lyase [Blyttiomyces sp. JEL0837]|nr:argininosuccinate lyase [Blyttiomyces sp. JEL0837]
MSLWGGRFVGKTDPHMHEFNASFKFDKRMCLVDIRASITYAKALATANVISASERDQLIDGLLLVEKEWKSASFISKESDEDIHTANERRLAELIGATAGKLHTGRSRNDQVATDMRLWLREESTSIAGYLKELLGVMISRAEVEVDLIMPGYTHLQRAQPIRWSHWLLSHVWSLKEDYDRLAQNIRRLNKLPLGSGALAGNPFNIDREFIARDLGFDEVLPNSLHAVGDRDFVVDFMTWASLTMVHLSRLAEDLIIFSSAEFGYVVQADAYSTGSSLMPQKKNPDAMELVRGKSGRVLGNMTGFLMTLKGLPSTYNKDLQEDKEPMFDTADTASKCIQIMAGALQTMKPVEEKMKSGLSYDMLATDLADYLVRKGVPFRETHHIAGQAVRLAEERKVELNQLSFADIKGLHPAFEPDVKDVFDFTASIDRRNAIGGTSRTTVLDQVEKLKKWLEQ